MSSRPRSKTIASCLADVGLAEIEVFAQCETRDDEFAIIKRAYRKRTLTEHPDKGGSNEAFHILQTSFELLRDLHDEKTQRRKKKNSEEWLFSDSLKTHGKAAKQRAKARSKTAVNDPDESSSNNSNKNDDEEEDFDMTAYDYDWSQAPMPSWEFFAEAAQDELPTYRVELAKSGRSKCRAKNGSKAKKCAEGLFRGKGEEEMEECTDVVAAGAEPEIIAKGEIRVGWSSNQAGSYGGWSHLRCWRVPSKVWKGLPQPTDDASADFEPYSIALTRMGDTVLSGFAELSKADQRAFIEHVRNKDANWTKEIKRKAIKAEEPPPAPVPLAFQDEDYQKMKQEQKAKAAAAKEEAAAPVSSSNDAIVVQSNAVTASAKQAFIIPKPGVNGASSETALKGKTFVLSGTFPEVGGGSGLSLGKAKAKAMIQSFGGRVTGSISGVTDVLVVGKNPGMSKVSSARNRPNIVLASLRDIKEGLDAGLESFEEFEIYKSHNAGDKMLIENFSAGYHSRRGGYNGLALTASKKTMLIAQGLIDPNEKLENDKPMSMLAIENGNEEDKKPAAVIKREAIENGPSENDENVGPSADIEPDAQPSGEASAEKKPKKKKASAPKKKVTGKKRGKTITDNHGDGDSPGEEAAVPKKRKTAKRGKKQAAAKTEA